MKRLLTLLLLAVVLHAAAQHTEPWEEYLDQLGETEDVETETCEAMYDVLSELAATPLNINTATREDLERLPFLTPQQVEDLSEYLYKYGPMRSLGELSMIESLDPTRVKLLGCFVFAGQPAGGRQLPTLQQVAHYGRHELTAAGRLPFYTRHGDVNGYLGYKYKHWLRYVFSYGQQVRIGLTGAQDAGEPFFAGRNKAGYDFYSFYLQLRDMGRLKALVAGRYRLKFGLGLILNNSFGFGKMATLSTLGNSSTSMRGHSSRSSANFLQGAAATVQVAPHVELTGFFSYRKIDATPGADSSTIQTILKTGYHRTQTEMDHKNLASQTLAGGNLAWRWHGLHAGITGFYTSLDHELAPQTTQRFRRYYARGSRFWNLSADYGYTSRTLTLNGETATGDCGALATINLLSWQPSSRLSLLALQRFYSYRFYSLMSRSFSEGGAEQNESGIYLGATWRPASHWELMLYTDYSHFAWPRYGADAPSHAWDNLLAVTWRSGRTAIYGRYRIKLGQQDNAEKTELITGTEQRGRLAFSYEADGWGLKTQADIANSHWQGNSLGWMVSQNLSWQHRRLRLYGSVGYFHTADYASRIYAYERGLLYDFSFPAFSGHGIRYALIVRTDLGSHVMLMTKLGSTDYFDRDHIASGYQQIDRSSQTDLDIQLRLKF